MLQVAIFDGFEYNDYNKLSRKVNDFCESHEIVSIANGCERGRPTYSFVFRTSESKESVNNAQQTQPKISLSITERLHAVLVILAGHTSDDEISCAYQELDDIIVKLSGGV